MNIYVGNLSCETTENELRSEFETYGRVDVARVVMDKMTSRSKGFGFVEMPDDEAAKKAIAELNNSEIDGRTIAVNVAEERKERPAGGGGGFRGGNRGGGGGFNRRSYNNEY